MQHDFFVYYTEASAICVIILLMILINSRIYSNKQEKQLWFERSIAAFTMYIISDAVWVAVLTDTVRNARWLAEICLLINYIMLSFATFCWFRFMAASERINIGESKKKRILSLSPMVFFFLIRLIVYTANPYYWINESYEVRPEYFLMMFASPTIYLMVGLVISVIKAHKASSLDEKKNYILLATFPIGAGVFGTIQLLGFNAPTFCLGISIMWLWFYIQNMQTLISVDDLTRLNNRGQINRHMRQIQYRDSVPTYVMMIDVDKFKAINDTFGHAEGDRALVTISDALKAACDQIKSPVFLGRYGGDEFTIILQATEDDEQPEYLASSIQNILSKMVKEKNLPYHLQISIGYEKLSGEKDSLHSCLARADKKLYQVKHKHHSEEKA